MVHVAYVTAEWSEAPWKRCHVVRRGRNNGRLPTCFGAFGTPPSDATASKGAGAGRRREIVEGFVSGVLFKGLFFSHRCEKRVFPT